MRRTYTGEGTLNKLHTIIRSCKAKRIFLVTGKDSYENSDFRRKVEVALKDTNHFRYSDFSLNPEYKDILVGVKKVQKFLPDLIIGIGGGSVLDTAKLLSIFSEKKINILDVTLGKSPTPKRKIELVLIPTTAGSGSESTHFSVMYVGKDKYSIASKTLLPDYSIVDPELTYTLSKHLTATTAFDALSHAIESYWSVSSTEKSRRYASSSIKYILEIFDTLITNPNKNTRKKMMWAAHLSGKAINLSKTTAAHALSYGFTTHYDVSHGHAVMLTLPSLFLHNADAKASRLNPGISFSEHKNRMSELCVLLGVKNASAAVLKLKTMLKKSELDCHVKHKKKDKTREMASLVASVNVERLRNNPVDITAKELERMVRSVFL